MGIYEYEITSLKNPIKFFAQAPWQNTFVRTEEHSISITDLPMIRNLRGEIFYPSYTNLSPVYFDEQTADFSCLKGSKVQIEVIASKELKSAKIVIEKYLNPADTNSTKIDTSFITMQVKDKKAQGSFTVSNTCSYYVVIYDTENQQNNGIIKYNIVATTDEYPSITLISPTTDVQITESGILPVLLSISDDYGFSKLLLHYRLAASRYTYPENEFKSLQIPINKNGTNFEVPYIWNLNTLGISPDDIYEFYFEIFDNDIVSGPKSTRSRTLALKLPSLDEVLQSADEQQQKIEQELEKIIRKAEEIKQDMNELNKELLKKSQQKELDWKDKKKAEDILKKQQDLENKINEVQQSLEDLTKNLQENKALSSETLQKYMELQNLLKEINSEELKILQQKMQQALQSISPDELQKLMKLTEFNEEMFRKSIERTINILKRLKAEQKADALNKRAEDLIKKQKELEQETENTNPNDANKRNELAKKQENLQQDLANLNNDLKELENLMKELGDDMPISELNKAQEELDYDQTSSEMKNSQSSLNQGNFQKAKQHQKKVGQNLANFAEQMKKVKSELEKNVRKEAIRKLQKAINNLIELSKKQENLQEITKNTDRNSVIYPNLSNEQVKLFNSLANTVNGLMELAQKSFAITPDMARLLGEALQNMQYAMQSLAERAPYGAANFQSEAMSAINQSTIQMQAMLSSLQNQGQGSCDNPGGMGEGQSQGAGSFMEKLQQLANQQQMLNQALQQLASGGQLTPEQQAQLSRLVQQQAAIQKSLEELNREQKQAQNRQKQTLGNLEKIIEQMKESISELKTGQIKPQTLQRQERILSRLLDATKSIHDRDYESKREATSADNIIRRSPPELELKNQEGRKKIFDDIIRSSKDIYTKDYENIIKQYFESLKNINVGN